MAFNKNNATTGQIFLQEQPAMPPPASAQNEHDLPTATVTLKAKSRKPKKVRPKSSFL